MISTDTITSLSPRLKARAITSERLTEDALANIAARQPELNAFITITAETALARAREADKEIAAGRYISPLHGIPLSVKDLVDISGVPTTAASRLRVGRVAKRDAPVVRHLRAAGAVFVGKTNLHEFAFGTTNEDSGWGPARNPNDPTRSPGGSSGGSAIAVHTGMSIASVGTDTGGSVRIPAAACGIVGLKPEWGEIDASGVIPLSRQLDHVGPLTRSVGDADVMYHVMRGASPRTETKIPSLPGMRLAILGGYFDDRLSESVGAVIASTYDWLGRKGASVTRTTLPHAADIAPVYLHLVLADAAAYHAVSLQQRPHAYTENVRIRLEMGRHVLAEDYVRALRGRAVITADVDRALANVDALILPALAVEAPPIGASTVPVKDGEEPVRNVMLRCTQPFNLSGHPALSLPCGTTSNGLPVGLQVVGHRGRTPELLSVARGIEEALQHRG